MANRVVALAVAVAAGALAVAEGATLRSRLRKSGTYRQTLHNFQDVQYWGDFTIGGQSIQGIFDTGSFELLVRSTRCEHCVHPTNPYDRSESHTYVKNGSVTQHVFGSGPCISMLGYEDVEVGPLRSKRQAFWEIVRHNIPVLDSAKFAAIVGIGPNFAYDNTEQTLLMQFGIHEFSVCLQKPRGSPGFLTWGQTSSPQFKEWYFAKARVLGKHHWGTVMHNVSFSQPSGSHLENLPCMGSGCAVILDSGTSLIAAPGYALMQLSQQLEPIMEDCSNLHELPTLRFTIDGNEFTLPPQAYVMRVTGAVMEADSIWDILFFKPKIRKVNMCLPAFMQIDMMSDQGPVWIMGMPFFRYYHTTFDRTNKLMHFAVAGQDCFPTPYQINGTRREIMLETGKHGADLGPMDIEVDKLVPPRLSGMMDFPFKNKGEIEF